MNPLMAVDPQKLEVSQTEPASSTHPAKALFHGLGFDVSHFPILRFVIETSEKNIRTGRLLLPLRLPDQPGYVYESVIRITRVLEVPSASNGTFQHRKFFEIEWLISDEASMDEHDHPALSFLAAQVECASCHEVFVPDPEIISDSSLRIVCPNCLNHWSVSVSAQQSNKEAKIPLLFDLFHREPHKVRNLIGKWDDPSAQLLDKSYFQHLPFHFQPLSSGSSVDFLFEDAIGYSSLLQRTAQTLAPEFETLIHAFLNYIAIQHFQMNDRDHYPSTLDRTEIQRKSDVVTLNSTQEIRSEQDLATLANSTFNDVAQETQTELTGDPFKQSFQNPAQKFTWSIPDTAVKEFKLPSERARTSTVRAQRNSSSLFVIGASLVVALAVGSIYLFQTRKSVTTPKVAEQTTVDESAPMSVSTSSLVAENEVHSPTVSSVQNIPAAPLAVEKETKQLANLEIKPATPSAAEPKKEVKTASKTKNSVTTEKVTSTPTLTSAETEQQRTARLQAIDTSFRQGMLHLKLQQTKEAILEFHRVITLDPKNPEAHRGLGLAYVYEQNFDGAISALGKYLELASTPDDRVSVEELIRTLKERAQQN